MSNCAYLKFITTKHTPCLPNFSPIQGVQVSNYLKKTLFDFHICFVDLNLLFMECIINFEPKTNLFVGWNNFLGFDPRGN